MRERKMRRCSALQNHLGEADVKNWTESSAPATSCGMSERPQSAQRQTPRFAKKREAILDAAARLFNQKGVKGATLADVAQSVALITNSVTYYYRKKEDLAAACFLRAIASLTDLALQAGRQSDPRARVKTLFRLYADLLRRIELGEQSEIVQFNDLLALGSPHGDVAFDAYNDLFRKIRALAPQPAQAKDGRANWNSRAHVIISSLHNLRQLLERYEPQDYLYVADGVADILLQGLCARGAVWAPKPLPGLAASLAPAGASDAFLQAATFLINEQGYRGASVEKISARLNVTKGSFYHHNDNKDDLVAQCFERTFNVIRAVQNAADALEASGWTKLTASAAELVRFQLSDAGPLLRASAFSVLPQGMRESVARTYDRLNQRFARFIVAGVADGSIRPVDQFIAAQLVANIVNAAAGLSRFSPSVNESSGPDLYVRPLFMGLFAD